MRNDAQESRLFDHTPLNRRKNASRFCPSIKGTLTVMDLATASSMAIYRHLPTPLAEYKGPKAT
jgi:hypothetical protein